MPEPLEDVLRRIDDWGAEHAAAAVVYPDGSARTHGDPSRRYPWASVTKPATAWAVLVACESGHLDLDEPAGPPGATVRHLLAHASGLPFDGEQVLAEPGRRRIYSNAGFDVLGSLLAERMGESFGAVLQRTVLGPLGMTGTDLVDRPSQGLAGSSGDLIALARELLRPRLIGTDLHALATAVVFPGLKGLVPGVGTFDPCDWGLGVEIHGGKRPHWMGATVSPAAFGHFGGSGTFLWVDPEADVAVVALTDRAFGPWALETWPTWSDALLAASAG